MPDVRRVGCDDIETLTFERTEPAPLCERHIRQLQPTCIAGCDLQRIAGHIDAKHVGTRPFRRDSKRNRSAPSAQVSNARRCVGVDVREHAFDDELRFRTWNQYSGPDLEQQ